MSSKSKRWGRGLLAWGVGLLLLGALATPAAALTSVSACGALPTSDNSFILTADLVQTSGNCLTIGKHGVTINLNNFSISGLSSGGGSDGIAITGSVSGALPNNTTIKGPGVIHDFGSCIVLGKFGLVQNVLVYNCLGEAGRGIQLGDFSKCVQCRVHNVRSSERNNVGILMGQGCLLESSIVETSDFGARVGHDCKVWDLVLEDIENTGLKVGWGTSVARSVISACHNGPGIDYCDCNLGPRAAFYAPGSACQDSSNSVSNCGSVIINNIADFTAATDFGMACVPTPAKAPRVITDCATNVNGVQYRPEEPREDTLSDGGEAQCNEGR